MRNIAGLADLTLFAAETRYVELAVTSSINPLADPVDVAFVARLTDPGGDDWKPAEWAPGQTWQAGQPITARVLVGPDDLVLAPGTYDAVVKVTDSPEIPWMLAGTVRIR